MSTKILGKAINPIEGLRRINNYTLQLYARRKGEMKARLGNKIPVILHNQDHLITLYNGSRSSVNYVPETYHLLKAIAHIPIAIHTTRLMKYAQDTKKLFSQLEGLFRSRQGISRPAPT